MKKISSLIAILLCAVTLFAQAPEKFTYQAVVRNASNSLVANAQVGVRMNILQGSASGNAVYSESHMATTNANGLITVNIGGGSVLHGIFASIDWANGPYFLKTDIDPNGGNDYSITSVQQLLSVPYALYAKDAGNGFSGDYNDLVNVPQIPQIPADISSFNNDAGYITSYTETDPQYNAWDKDYNDLINKPTIPTVPSNVSAFTNDAGYITLNQVPAQVNADWTATSGAALILNKPTLFSGNYNDLTNKPNLFDGNYNSLSNKPNLSTVAISGSYNDLINKPSIPTTVGELTNNVGYITLAQVPAQVNADWNATTGAAQILNKPTIPTVPTNVSAFTNDAGYITNAAIPAMPTNVSAFTNDAGYVTAADVQQAAGVPTNVSAFNNDMGYLTSYTETDPLFTAWGKNYNTLNNKPNLATVATSGNYNDLSNKPTIPTNVSAFTNDAGYITATQVPEQVNADWNATSGKAKILNKPTIPTVPTNISAFTNDVGYVTSTDVQQAVGVPTVVSAFQNDVGYITADQIPTQINADWNATAGAAQILNKPSLFSGNYNDLINKPTFAVVATSGNYNDLNNKPALFSGNYNDLSNRPNFATVATSGNYNDLTNKPNIPTVPTNVSSFSNDAYYVTYNQLLSLIDSIKSIYNSKIDSLNDVISSIDNQSSLPCGSYVVSDFDGNIYTTVPIGSQCWLQQNLRTTKYGDGEPITAGGVGTGNWTSSTSIAYWYYPNDQNVASHIDGYMYNVKAVLHNDSYASNSSTSVQGPCPNGWHVPSKSEWNTLVDYVLNNNLLACGSGAAKALASTSGWTSTGNNNCCPTSNTFPEKANRTGFSALPCGYLKPSSTGSSWGFLEYGEAAYFWTTPSSSSPKLFRIRYSYSTTDITSAGMSSWYAFPIRCLRD